MIILLSPAKSLDYESEISCPKHTKPIFTDEIAQLRESLKKLKANDLKSLMGISDKLATLNYDRFQQFAPDFNQSNARQALLAFNGDVYNGIDTQHYSADDFDFAQEHLRILSGLYGILRPLDLIQPYRLEMGTDFKKLSKSTLSKEINATNLYQFWGDKLSRYLNETSTPTIINLASNEYFSAIDQKALKPKVIHIAFKEKKGDVLKIIGISAKKARGLMTNYIIKQKISDPKALKKFNEERYVFNEALSNDSNFVFTR